MIESLANETFISDLFVGLWEIPNMKADVLWKKIFLEEKVQTIDHHYLTDEASSKKSGKAKLILIA